jgi:hypothetical protein
MVLGYTRRVDTGSLPQRGGGHRGFERYRPRGRLCLRPRGLEARPRRARAGPLQTLAEEIEGMGAPAIAVPTDVRDEEAVESLQHSGVTSASPRCGGA